MARNRTIILEIPVGIAYDSEALRRTDTFGETFTAIVTVAREWMGVELTLNNIADIISEHLDPEYALEARSVVDMMSKDDVPRNYHQKGIVVPRAIETTFHVPEDILTRFYN